MLFRSSVCFENPAETEKTGHFLDEWKKIIAKEKLAKHGEIVKFLKESHMVTHGYASEIALKVLGSDANSTIDTNSCPGGVFTVFTYKL